MATVWRTQCAFARLLIGKSSQILNNAAHLGGRISPESKSLLWYNIRQTCQPKFSVVMLKKYSSYAQSPFVSKIQEQYEYEVVKKPPEWKYVQSLLPFDTVPAITPKEAYPSGWVPPREEAGDLPYFIPRNKNHAVPIHLNITYRGMRKITRIKRIEGDIWMMNDEIKAYLKNLHKKYIETRVHELAKTIEVKGDYVNDIINWAYSKGF